MARAAITTQCVHRWILGTPQGQTIRGVCLYCGAERDFAADLQAQARRQVTVLFQDRGLARRRPRHSGGPL